MTPGTVLAMGNTTSYHKRFRNKNATGTAMQASSTIMWHCIMLQLQAALRSKFHHVFRSISGLPCVTGYPRSISQSPPQALRVKWPGTRTTLFRRPRFTAQARPATLTMSLDLGIDPDGVYVLSKGVGDSSWVTIAQFWFWQSGITIYIGNIREQDCQKTSISIID